MTDIGFDLWHDTEPEDLTLDQKIQQAHWIVNMALHTHVTMAEKLLVGSVLLFSGGNDSNVLAHLMRGHITHFGHANTGIGIEQTRQHVRDVARSWDIPLLEFPGDSYRELVLERGFPGPGQHFKMYQRLKERALRKIRRELVTHSRKERVLFIAGRRRAESSRRESREIPEFEVEGSVVWVSPLVHWTSADMRAYRERFPDTPTNEVSAMIHMSGECLCGAFAAKGELDEIGFFFPEVRSEIEVLEAEVEAAGIPEPRCRWGWGAYRDTPGVHQSGRMCSSCDARQGGES